MASELPANNQNQQTTKVNSAATHTFEEHRKFAIAIVRTWPDWKRALLGGVVRHQGQHSSNHAK